MATNSLTGDFQAIFQIATLQLNALLATLHQNGAIPGASLQLLHSVNVSVGGRKRVPDLDDFGDWVFDLARAGRTTPASDVRGDLIAAAPPGAAARMRSTFADFDQLTAPLTPIPVRGRADVQISNVTLTFPAGSTSEATIHARVRAHYRPAPGTPSLPAPVHGNVAATFNIRIVQAASGRRLEIRPSSNDSKITFEPVAGTVTPAEAGSITTQVRHAVREQFTLVPVDLPSQFPFGGFKGVGTDAAQALALGLQLSGAAPGAAGLQAVTQSIAPSGFAFAVSKAFVTTVFQPALDSLKQFKQDVPGPGSVTFHVSVTNALADFNNGSIDLRITAKATSSAFPTLNINIRQRCTLVLFLDRLFIAAPNDELSVSVSTGGIPFPSGNLKSHVIAARDAALPSAQDALNTQVAAARTRVNDALRMFDPSASLRLRAGHSEETNAASTGGIAITEEGIIVRGDFLLSSRIAPVVDIRETVDETAFTALESWIPGGRLERLLWSWVEFNGPFAWGGEVKTLLTLHEFILPKPAGITNRSQICLRISGPAIMPTGGAITVAGGAVCQVPALPTLTVAPSWWEPVMVPIWHPDVAADAVLEDALAGHVSLQSDTAPDAAALTHNTLVYFADWNDSAPLASLGEALKHLQRRGPSVAIVVVLPAGAFKARRREVEVKLRGIDEPFAANLHVTEDDQGGWTNTFAPSTRPAVFLINARREFDWKYEGSLEPRELAAALDRRLQVAPPPRLVPLRLRPAPDCRALDATFQDVNGEQAALHRFVGRRHMLSFWHAWSAPCLAELRRLSTMYGRPTEEQPTIVAFHGGPQSDLDRVRKELALPFTLVQDVDQVVARLYGVRCWPTTVTIGPDARVEHVQFGVPARERDASQFGGDEDVT